MSAESQQESYHGESLHGETAARRQAVTELLFFASVGDLHRCKKLCAKWDLQPKDAYCRDYDKRTPLHLAAAEGCYSVVVWLVEECDAPVNPVDRFYRTPVEDAVRGDHGEVTNFLVQHDGKIMTKDGTLVPLADSPLSGNVRIFGEFDPEWEIDPDNLKIEEMLGEGEFGIVYKANLHGTKVAVKVLREQTSMALGDFRTELNLLQKIHHPHAVQFLGAVTKRNPYMIITEYLVGGSLDDMFRMHEYPGVRRALQLALDTARGMAYMHNHQPMSVIHRDLKPQNLMIGGHHIYEEKHREWMYHEVGVVKIADFGLSKTLKLHKPQRFGIEVAAGTTDNAKLDDVYKMTGETGSYRYMAPEVFRHEPYNNKVDVFAFAMIVYQMLEGHAPFPLLDPVQAARAVADGTRPSWGAKNRFGKVVPEPLRKLVESCWADDFNARPSFPYIVDEMESILKNLPDAGDENSRSSRRSCCSIQ